MRMKLRVGVAFSAGLLAVVATAGLLASGAALGAAHAPRPKLSVSLVRSPQGRRHGHGRQPDDSCSQNCSFPEGPITLELSVTDSPCDGGYTFDVDPGDGSGAITGIPIEGSCDTSQDPSVFTGSGSTTHTYADESNGALSVVFTLHDPDVGAVPLAPVSLTISEGDSLVGHGINIGVKLGKQFSGPIATFTDTPANGLTAPASDMFPTVDWGDGSPPGSTLDGTVSVSDDGSGTFTVSGTHTYAGSPGPWLITIKLEDDQPGTASALAHAKASVRTFTASPRSAVKSGTTINYQGTGFDAGGDQITIGWDDLVDPVQNTTLPAANTFNGSLTATFGHPQSDAEKACTANLTATQDGSTDTLPVTGTQLGVVLAQRNVFRNVDGQPVPIEPPDIFCDGERFATQASFDLLVDSFTGGPPQQGAEAALVGQDVPELQGSGVLPVSGYIDNGAWSTDAAGSIQVARGATLCMPLGPPTGLTSPHPSALYGSMIMPPGRQGPFTAGRIGSGCLSTAPNGTGVDVVGPNASCTRTIKGGTVDRLVVFPNETVCVQGSLVVRHDVTLKYGELAVTGNLTIDDAIQGIGALLVNGGTVVKGSFTDWRTDQSLLLGAGGDVHFLKE